MSIQKLLIEDYAPMVVLSSLIGGFYWSMFVIILVPFVPLLTFSVPQIGILFFLFASWLYYDRNTPKMGGRKSKWFTNLKLFDLLRNYFSNRLIKTAELPEGRNYILAHYPHSVAPFSILPNFLSNSNKVADIFPGIEMHTVTLDVTFFIPFVREFFLAIGACACSQSSFTYLLKSPPSKGIVVVPGGAAEVQYAGAGNIYTIVKRKGFIRLALATGTPVVPVFTFGEINAWTKVLFVPLGEPIEKIIKYLTKCSVTLFFPFGRGLLPRRIPVNTIVGAPIPVPKIENPSKELVDRYQDIFFQSLQDLFEEYKHEYDRAGKSAKLVMI